MCFFDWILGKKKYDPREHVDWDVYNQDYYNGMSYAEQEAKIASGGYEKGKAKPSTEHGRIDDVEYYNLYIKYYGEKSAELARQTGAFMIKE